MDMEAMNLGGSCAIEQFEVWLTELNYKTHNRIEKEYVPVVVVTDNPTCEHLTAVPLRNLDEMQPFQVYLRGPGDMGSCVAACDELLTLSVYALKERIGSLCHEDDRNAIKRSIAKLMRLEAFA